MNQKNIYRKQPLSYQSLQSNRSNKNSQFIMKQSWIGNSNFQQEKQKSQNSIKNTNSNQNSQKKQKQQYKSNSINQFDQFNRIRIGSIQKDQEKRSIQSPLTKLANSFYKIQDSQISNKSKQIQRSPTQLIQDIFRGIGLDHYPTSKAYYSRQSQQNLSQILSNKNKLHNYIKRLSNSIATSNSAQVTKNYQILLILLIHLSQSNLQIHHSNNKGLQIKFNRTQLDQKQKQIQKLQKQLQEKNKQAEKIVQQYQGVIRNFNDVIEKLVSQKKKKQY